MNFAALNPDTDSFMTKVTDEFSGPYEVAMLNLRDAIVLQNQPMARDARDELASLMSKAMGMGELLGASMALRSSADVIAKDANFAKEIGLKCTHHEMHFAKIPTNQLIPRFGFEHAIQDIIDRTPVTLRTAAERTAQKIAQIYADGKAVVFSRASEAAVTREVQRTIASMMRSGESEVIAGRAIAQNANEVRKRSKLWTEAYARTVFRNNVNTGTTAGRFRATRDPAIQKILPAKMFNAVGDSDVRHNHQAADGLIWSVNNPIWNFMATPIGHNCRCGLRDVSVPELRRLGRIEPNTGAVRQSPLPRSAHPDEGWRPTGRPDFFVESMIV